MSDDNVKPIGIKHRDAHGKMFEIIQHKSGECYEHAYIIDEHAGTVQCSKCNYFLSPMHALLDLARKESRWMQNLIDYKDRMKRLAERRRTTCEHCKQMTRIKGE